MRLDMFDNISNCCEKMESIEVVYCDYGFRASLWTTADGYAKQVSVAYGDTIQSAIEKLNDRLAGLNVDWVRQGS